MYFGRIIFHKNHHKNNIEYFSVIPFDGTVQLLQRVPYNDQMQAEFFTLAQGTQMRYLAASSSHSRIVMTKYNCELIPKKCLVGLQFDDVIIVDR